MATGISLPEAAGKAIDVKTIVLLSVVSSMQNKEGAGLPVAG